MTSTSRLVVSGARVTAVVTVVLVLAGVEGRADASVGSAVFRKAAPAVVVVDTASGSGSAFSFGRPGQYLTNCHVVTEDGWDGESRVAPSIKIRTKAGVVGSAEVVKMDCALDVALLRSSVAVPTLASPSVAPSPGDDVWAIGAPLGHDWSITSGSLSSLDATPRSDAESGRNRHLLETDTPINHGNSGGPFLNSKAEVIGIASQLEMDPQTGGGLPVRAEGVNYGIPIQQATAALGIPANSAGGSSPPPRESPKKGAGKESSGEGPFGVGAWVLVLLAILTGAVVSLRRRSRGSASRDKSDLDRSRQSTWNGARDVPVTVRTPQRESLSDFEVTVHGRRTAGEADADVEIVFRERGQTSGRAQDT